MANFFRLHHARSYHLEMRLFGRERPGQVADEPDPEDDDVRRYRFILRTAQPEVQARVNEAALGALHGEDRRAILAVLQRHAAVGDRADPEDLQALARHISRSEARDPGVLLKNGAPEVMRELARKALASSAASGLMSGYASWDGADPQMSEEKWQDASYGKKFDAAMKQRRKDAWGQTGQQL